MVVGPGLGKRAARDGLLCEFRLLNLLGSEADLSDPPDLGTFFQITLRSWHRWLAPPAGPPGTARNRQVIE